MRKKMKKDIASGEIKKRPVPSQRKDPYLIDKN